MAQPDRTDDELQTPDGCGRSPFCGLAMHGRLQRYQQPALGLAGSAVEAVSNRDPEQGELIAVNCSAPSDRGRSHGFGNSLFHSYPSALENRNSIARLQTK
jgi:hypothetical protein